MGGKSKEFKIKPGLNFQDYVFLNKSSGLTK